MSPDIHDMNLVLRARIDLSTHQSVLDIDGVLTRQIEKNFIRFGAKMVVWPKAPTLPIISTTNFLRQSERICNTKSSESKMAEKKERRRAK